MRPRTDSSRRPANQPHGVREKGRGSHRLEPVFGGGDKRLGAAALVPVEADADGLFRSDHSTIRSPIGSWRFFQTRASGTATAPLAGRCPTRAARAVHSASDPTRVCAAGVESVIRRSACLGLTGDACRNARHTSGCHAAEGMATGTSCSTIDLVTERPTGRSRLERTARSASARTVGQNRSDAPCRQLSSCPYPSTDEPCRPGFQSAWL